jgi:hypothetical protein
LKLKANLKAVTYISASRAWLQALSTWFDRVKLQRLTEATSTHMSGGIGVDTWVQRHKFNLKAEVERSTSHFSFKRVVPGGFNLGFIGSTCTALPWWWWG